MDGSEARELPGVIDDNSHRLLIDSFKTGIIVKMKSHDRQSPILLTLYPIL